MEYLRIALLKVQYTSILMPIGNAIKNNLITEAAGSLSHKPTPFHGQTISPLTPSIAKLQL